MRATIASGLGAGRKQPYGDLRDRETPHSRSSNGQAPELEEISNTTVKDGKVAGREGVRPFQPKANACGRKDSKSAGQGSRNGKLINAREL